MAAKQPKYDADGLIVDEVGPWAREKHERIKRYINASRGARSKFLPPRGIGAASYIELFSGPGRSLIRDTDRILDGSPLVAFKAAKDSGALFSEIHLNDFDPEKANAVKQRIHALGGTCTTYSASAEVAVDHIANAMNPSGLHFAFIDPYKLEQLPFTIIEKLAKFPRMDMLIHVSLHDLQRNSDAYTEPGAVFDSFAPGWRDEVDPLQSNNALRAAMLKYWLKKIQALGTIPAEGIELITSDRNVRLYWLVYVSRHNLGRKLWEDIRDLRGQSKMDF
jgi:three-Cys-motif partner protein